MKDFSSRVGFSIFMKWIILCRTFTKQVFPSVLFLSLFSVSISSYAQNNSPDPVVNLALLPDATVTSNVPEGRGIPLDIFYDPGTSNYKNITLWNEHGVEFGQNLGIVPENDPVYWKIDWSSPKSINYITFGGSYPNQPQPNTGWKIRYYNGSSWIVLDQGIGGWVDSGIYVWGGESQQPIIATILQLELYSSANNDLVSIHLRARGGVSARVDDSGETLKACLIQYLGSGSGGAPIPVTGITVSPTSRTLEVGQTGSHTATVTPSNATNQSVNWNSSNTAVATVSGSGQITAVSAGNATITASAAENPTITSQVSVTVSATSGGGGDPSGGGETVWASGSNNNIYYNDGNVGIGTTTPDEKLAVNGNIHAREVRVDLNGWPDYVFKDGYQLPTLAKVQQHIKEKGHLPNIPSAKEVEENGIELGEMNKLLLEKIEELILYTLQQEKELSAQKKYNEEMKEKEAKLGKMNRLLLDKIEGLTSYLLDLKERENIVEEELKKLRREVRNLEKTKK